MRNTLERVIPIIKHLEEKAQRRLLEKLRPFIKEILPEEKESLVWKKTLILTDCLEGVALAENAGLPCIGIMQGEKALEAGASTDLKEALEADYLPCKYLVTGMEAITDVYLERVYRRFHGMPWDILETERCVVRESTEEDAEVILQLYEESKEFALQAPFSNPQEGRDYIQKYRQRVYEFYEYGLWTIEEKRSGRMIGIAGLENQIFEEKEYMALGYIIGRAWRRQGYGEEVCRAILEYGRTELELSKVHCFIAPDNKGSQALAEKLGFRRIEAGEKWNYLAILRDS